MLTLLHGPGCNLGSGSGAPSLCTVGRICKRCTHGLRCYGNITRTRNVSEYMLVLALCLVYSSGASVLPLPRTQDIFAIAKLSCFKGITSVLN